ncbi:MAG: cobalt ECF transporter T component CbiQ [Candidatus Humimicrobiaceae bacterium]
MKNLIDIRVKLIITVVTIFFIVSVPKSSYISFSFYFILCLITALIFKPDFVRFIKRLSGLYMIPLFLSIFIPFASAGEILYEIDLNIITVGITDAGLATFYMVLIKSFLSLFLISALIVSTDEREIFWGLRKLYIPKIVVSIIFLMYRYLFLFKDEFETGKRAVNSRIFNKSGFIKNKKTGYLIGSLFIRAFTKAENIYMTMQSRGFDGSFYLLSDSPKINKTSVAIIISLLLFNIAIRSFGFFNFLSSVKLI